MLFSVVYVIITVFILKLNRTKGRLSLALNFFYFYPSPICFYHNFSQYLKSDHAHPDHFKF